MASLYIPSRARVGRIGSDSMIHICQIVTFRTCRNHGFHTFWQNGSRTGSEMGPRNRRIWTPKGSKTGRGDPWTATIQEGKTPFYGNSTLQMVSEGPSEDDQNRGPKWTPPKWSFLDPIFGQVRNRSGPCFDTLDVTFEHRGVKFHAYALKPQIDTMSLWVESPGAPGPWTPFGGPNGPTDIPGRSRFRACI